MERDRRTFMYGSKDLEVVERRKPVGLLRLLAVFELGLDDEEGSLDGTFGCRMDVEVA
jgi:hypothetical protein